MQQLVTHLNKLDNLDIINNKLVNLDKINKLDKLDSLDNLVQIYNKLEILNKLNKLDSLDTLVNSVATNNAEGGLRYWSSSSGQRNAFALKKDSRKLNY